MSVAAPVEPTDARQRASVAQTLSDHPLIMLTAILVALLIACQLADSSYISDNRLGTILRLAAPLAIIAAGQTIVMLTAGIDLSVGFTATAAAYVMAGQTGTGTNTTVAILIGLGVGLGIGVVNGVGVGVFNVNPLIMTLGMGSIIIGLLTVGAQSWSFLQNAADVPSFVNEVATTNLFWVIPKSTLLWVVLAAVLIYGLRRSGFGRMLYAYGDNPLAVRLAGTRSWQLVIAAYALCSLCAAIGGLLLIGLTNSADLGLGTSYLLPSVAAVVIGGTSIFGGIGTYSGTIMGALILTVLDSFLQLIDVAQSVRQILYGAIILTLAAVYARLSGRA